VKVLLISDFSLETHPGGAQVSNDLVIKKGLDLGYDVTLHSINSSPINLINDYDIIISSNLDHFSRTSQFPLILEKILNHPFHTRYEHDSCLYLDKTTRKQIFESTKVNFFLSNFHLQFFQKYYGDYFKNCEIVYDPIDTESFINQNTERVYDTIYCGYAHMLKGFDRFVDYARRNQDEKIAFVGWFDNEELKETISTIKNIEIIGKVPNKEVPSYFNKSKKVFHNPIVNEPFCRMVGEALLCGCELVGDKNKIGSYLEYKESGEEVFREKCKNATTEFWEIIKNKYEDNSSS